MATIPFKRAIAGILFILFWIGLILIRHMPPLSVQDWASWVPLRCPLSWIFDVQCPTCGLGRALIAAALGHAQESLRYHPFGLPLFWGAQALLLFWILWPRRSASMWRHVLILCRRHQAVLWVLVLFYSVWGFCWRSPIP